MQLREFKTILPSTFIYELILMKIYMNADIKLNLKVFFYFIKYDLKGHQKSYKVTFMFKIFIYFSSQI